VQHTSYGLFDVDADARAALDAVEASGTPRQHFGVTIHRNRLDEGLVGASGTSASEGAREGAAIAAILGAIAGAVTMGPVGLISGGALGALYGGMGGAIAGAGAPDHTLERLSKELASGKVLIVVEASSVEARDRADSIIREHGGHVDHKPFF
jgi:hypothetical protein